MAPKVKKQTAAEKEAADFIKSLLKQHNIEAPELPETTHGEPTQDYEMDDSPQRQLFHAQGVVKSLEYPLASRITKVCKHCGDPFTTNYYSVAYCSILCGELDCKKHFGLAWKPHARIKKERWEVLAEPEIVTMRALQAMKMIVARVEADLGHPIEIDQQAFSQLPSGLLREEQPSSASELQLVPALPPEDKKTTPVQPLQLQEEEDDSLAWLYA